MIDERPDTASRIRTALGSTARASIKAAAAGWDLLDRPTPGIVVLIYHRVGQGSGGQMDLDGATFERQLRWLRSNTRVISLDDAAEELVGGAPTRRVAPGVVVTFDDGTTDWLDFVLPALERHEVPATFYVATDFIDRHLAFPGDGRPLSWAALAELASSPLVTVGSHTHRHVLLDRLPTAEVAADLDRSIELLADRVGTEVRHFAYPKAVAGSPAAESEVRARFATAVLAGSRANRDGTDLHRIRRTPVQRADGFRSFRRKAAGGMHLEDDIRTTANRLRYRGATS